MGIRLKKTSFVEFKYIPIGAVFSAKTIPAPYYEEKLYIKVSDGILAVNSGESEEIIFNSVCIGDGTLRNFGENDLVKHLKENLRISRSLFETED